MTPQATKLFRAAVLAAVLAMASCNRSPGSETATNPAASGDGAGMPNMPRAGGEHTAQGTVNSVDQAGRTVNISHGPVASANWPAMTMSFKLADRAAASSLEAGQRVEFHFTIHSGMDATVTQIEAIE